MSLHRVIVAVAAALGFVLLLAGCGRMGDQMVQVKGSDTMSPISQAWAEEYRKTHPDMEVAVTGGGSGVGFASILNRTTDIAMSSREISDSERDAMLERDMAPQEFHVASDGLSVIVHPSNAVDRLTIAQLSQIYRGDLRNWREVGGNDAPIVLISRDRNSGTYMFFLEQVVREGDPARTDQMATHAQLSVSNQPIAEQVATNPNAIGYIGLGFLEPDRHKAVLVAATAAAPYIGPSEATVLSGEYPISRAMYYYTPNPPEGAVREFLDFVLSDEGQAVVERVGFVPVREVGAVEN